MSLLERAWYKKATWLYLLWPLSLLYRVLSVAKFRQQRSRAVDSTVPVIVVGNLTVGGTGKTPVVMALAKALHEAGMNPGIVTRGYGGTATYPLWIDSDTPVEQSGDEAKLMACTLGLPVVADPNRARALSTITGTKQSRSNRTVDIVISDDGLQHYALPRTVEWVLIDGQRGLGNGMLLPAGPLREPLQRLESADALLVNGSVEQGVEPGWRRSGLPEYAIEARPLGLRHQRSGRLDAFNAKSFAEFSKLQVVTGIGNPDRFLRLLSVLSVPLETHIFADHHCFAAQDFAALDSSQPIVMTAKDAVKCTEFAAENFWTLEAEIELPQALLESLQGRLAQQSAP